MSSFKRENNCIVLSSNNVILDIEGTTTSITFVKDVLFPYVRKHLESYVKENWDSEGFQAILNSLKIQAKEDKEKKMDGVVDIPEDGGKDDMVKAVVKNVLWQMDHDSKAKSLKDLQGLIMEIGYKKGELKGHIYEDVEPNLKLWTELGKSVYIYSSGSVHAQKLLYGHSEKGDLLPYIIGHFDTTVGKKGDVESYKKIVEQISGSPSETVFFTDIPTEAKAAKEAGLLTILLSREGNAPLTDEDKREYQVIESFSEIQFENSSKKRKVCTNNDDKNDNKSVQSCEVSLKPPKEPTNSTQQPDVKMEVEESSIEEKVCNLEKVGENVEDKNSQQNEATESDDFEMRPSPGIVEENTSLKANTIVETQTKEELNNGDVTKETNSEELKVENNEVHYENKKVNADKPSESLDKLHEKIEPTVDKSNSNNTEDELTTAINESQSCEDKTCLKAEEVIKEPSNGKISENGKSAKEQADHANSTIQSGDVSHNSTDETESKLEPNIPCIENKSDIEIEKSSIKQNDTLNPNINCMLDCVNNVNLLKNDDNGMIGDKKLSDLSKVSTNGNHSVNTKATKPSENDTDLDEKSCLKKVINSVDGTPNVTLPQDALPTDLNTNTNRVGTDERAVEIPEILETESVKESSTPTERMDYNSDVKVQENLPLESEAKITDGNISENTQTNNLEENSGLKSCITVDSSPLKTSCENIDKSNSDQAKSEKVEIDKANIEMSKEEGEISNKDKPDQELHTKSAKEPSLCDTVSEPNTKSQNKNKTDLKNKTDSSISAETGQNSAESFSDGNEQITKLAHTPDKKLIKETDCDLIAKEVITAADSKNDAKEDLNQTGKKESTMSQNGSVDSNSESIKCSEDKELKNGVHETSDCEVKKCEVPENTAIAAVVEA